MDLLRIWHRYPQLQEVLKPNEGTVRPEEATSGHPNSTLRPLKINDHVYEVLRPQGAPSVELVFFHGLQLDSKSSREAHINTWVSRDGSACWLPWLLESIPAARILTVLYDGAARKTDREGRMDMFVTGENLVHTLTAAKVGQSDCPVVLVGHCLGGLVIKEVCCQADQMIIRKVHPRAVEMFLKSIRGCFFYATPHLGSFFCDSIRQTLSAPLIEALRTLEVHTARRNEDFRHLRQEKQWKTSGVFAQLPLTTKFYNDVVVPEASARSDMDEFHSVDVNHFDVSRPTDKFSASFQLVKDFTNKIVEEWNEARDDHNYVLVPPTSDHDVGDGHTEYDPRQRWIIQTARPLFFRLWIVSIFAIFIFSAQVSYHRFKTDVDETPLVFLGIPVLGFALSALFYHLGLHLLEYCLTRKRVAQKELLEVEPLV